MVNSSDKRFHLANLALVLPWALLMYFDVQSDGWPQGLGRFIGYFVLCNSVFVVALVWICLPIDPMDRGLFFRQVMWVVFPLIFLVNAFFFTPCLPLSLLPFSINFEYEPGSAMVMLEGINELFGMLNDLLSLVIVSIVYYFWFSLRWPFLRKNLSMNARNRPATREAMTRLIGPNMTFEEAETAAIRISPRIYYSLIALLFWLIFIVAETVLSEALGDWFGSAGYLGASAIAIAIGAAFYPLHQRASKYLDARPDDDPVDGASDIKSALTAVNRSMSLHAKREGRTMRGMIPSFRRVMLYFALGFGGLIVILTVIVAFDLFSQRL